MYIVKNKTLVVLILVMIVNALSYGILVPLLYPYASRYGLNATGLGALFASFSFFQFFATPVMGRLSDRFGRKPLLILSLMGTSVSLALFALAWNAPLLFLARILDGVTGGNNSVAQAVIADSTDGEERAKSFGIIGASYGFGFLIGPALGGLVGGLSLTAPFWLASGLALIASVMTYFFLEETNTDKSEVLVATEGVFNVSKWIQVFTTPVVGVALLITLVSATAHNGFVIGFQSYSVDVLFLSPQSVGLIFSLIGLLSIIMQSIGIRWLLKRFSSQERLLQVSLLGTAVVMVAFSVTQDISQFVLMSMAYILCFAPQMVLTSALISMRTNKEDQGGILGINQSFLSLGQIIGPLVAAVMSTISLEVVFLVAAVIFFVGFSISLTLNKSYKKFDL